MYKSMLYFFSLMWNISYCTNEIKVAYISTFESQELLSITKWDQTIKGFGHLSIQLSPGRRVSGVALRFMLELRWDLNSKTLL